VTPIMNSSPLPDSVTKVEMKQPKKSSIVEDLKQQPIHSQKDPSSSQQEPVESKSTPTPIPEHPKMSEPVKQKTIYPNFRRRLKPAKTSVRYNAGFADNSCTVADSRIWRLRGRSTRS